MVELPGLDRLVLNLPPVLAELPLVHVNDGPADQVITEEIIVVPELNLKGRSAREGGIELEGLVKLRIGLVQLVLVLTVVLECSTSDEEVGIGGGADVSRGKIEAFKDVESDSAAGRGRQLLLKQVFVA